MSPVVPLRCASPLCLPGEAFATADRPARSEQWSCGGEQFQAAPRSDTTGAIDFPSQIVKSPQVLSHLLLVVTIFPLPHPCAIRFPKSNRPTPTSPISSALQWSLFSFFSVYIIFLLCLPLCLSVLPPRGGVCNCWPSSPFWAVKLWGRAVPSASPVRHNGCHRFPKSNQSNRQISTSPISSAFPCHTHVPLDFPSQIVKRSNTHKSYLICFAVVAIQLFLILHHFPVVSPVVPLRCVSPGRRLQLLTVQTVLSSEAVGWAVPSASPVRHNWCHRFPKSNRQTSTNPISSAFSGRYFSLAAPMLH